MINDKTLQKLEDRKRFKKFIENDALNYLIGEIIDKILTYSYDNTLFNINIPETRNFIYNNVTILKSFDKAIEQLGIKKSLVNEQLDSYLKTLLLNGKISLKLENDKYVISDKKGEYIIKIKIDNKFNKTIYKNESNYIFAHLPKNYMKNLYKEYNKNNNFAKLLLENKQIIIDLRTCICEIIKEATIRNLKTTNSRFQNFLLNVFRIKPKFDIMLNDEKILIAEFSNFDIERINNQANKIKDFKEKKTKTS